MKPATAKWVSAWCQRAMSRKVRTVAEFAEQELVLPEDGGPHEGERFRLDSQPFARLLYHEIDNGHWSEIYVTGPSQSGKTLMCFVALVAHTALERRRNCVIGVPDANMANDKWQIDIEPIFRASPSLRRLLPVSGSGSKGGRVRDAVTLTNGVTLKFMSPGGDDANKAGFTAPVIVVTEAARFSDPGQSSVEADPLRQLRARQRATSRFDADGELSLARRMFVEGTVTTEDELPWRAKIGSTDSRIACPCVHCGKFVTPEREHLRGWEDATSDLEAARQAAFFCPECGERISDEERAAMNRRAVLLHAGQTVDDSGVIVGSAPETSKLFFRWSAFNNLFVRSSDLGLEEWSALQLDEDSRDRENAEKDLCQSIWCQPYSPPRIDRAPLKAESIRGRKAMWSVGVLPGDTDLFTVGVDVGRWRCWYFAMAFRSNGAVHCPVYGSHDTSIPRQAKSDEISSDLEHTAILECLRELREMFDRGWITEGKGDLLIPQAVWIDSGYYPSSVFEFAREAGRGANARFMPLIGRGKSQRDARQYTKPSRSGAEVRRIGDGWHQSYVRSRAAWQVTVDADWAKMTVQDMLRVQSGNPGSLTLASGPSDDHRRVARHLRAEITREIHDPDKGIVTEWIKTGQNHLLDCAAYALAAGTFLGYRMPSERAHPVEGDEDPTVPWIDRILG